MLYLYRLLSFENRWTDFGRSVCKKTVLNHSAHHTEMKLVQERFYIQSIMINVINLDTRT
jgi:hypothetical protein